MKKFSIGEHVTLINVDGLYPETYEAHGILLLKFFKWKEAIVVPNEDEEAREEDYTISFTDEEYLRFKWAVKEDNLLSLDDFYTPSVTAMFRYGYNWLGVHLCSVHYALDNLEDNYNILLLENNGTEIFPETKEDIIKHHIEGGLFGIVLKEGEMSSVRCPLCGNIMKVSGMSTDNDNHEVSVVLCCLTKNCGVEVSQTIPFYGYERDEETELLSSKKGV